MNLHRQLRSLFLVGLAAFVAPAIAFHEQGVASCSGCHILHSSVDGQPVFDQVEGLIAESASDVCLTCHALEAGAVLGLDALMPPEEKGGGNFVFLLEDNLNDGPGGETDPIPGDAAGHNIVAPGWGVAADLRHQTSPGGSFPSADLACTSCHDPHGNGNFRMLLGAGEVQGGLAVFSAPAPDAEGIDLTSGGERPDSHTAYRNGMSEWCGNCHGRFHDEGLGGFEHPSDLQLGIDEQTRYNAYDGDDNPSGGSQALAYLAEVPFEEATADTDSRRGPTAIARVMCLTCHRAHASSAPAAGRWDFNVSLLIEDGVASGSYPIPDPYASPAQGTLCSKCHEPLPASGESLGRGIPFDR